MIRTLLASHPSEETLSRLADEDELSRARSRAGRHVARCTECKSVIDEYDALGSAARAVPAATVPETLRNRVLSSAPLVGQAAGRARTPVVAVAPAPSIARRRSRAVSRSLAIAASAAGVLLAALGWPLLRHHDLAAADAQRLTVFPRYPRAGTTVRLHFAPPAGMTPAETLWVEGIFRVADSDSGRPRDELPVADALVRTGDEYRGTLDVPTHAVAGAIYVLDPRAARVSRRLASALVLSAGPSGDRPSLDALEEATEGFAFFQSRAQLAAEFARWAPDHPMRWLLEPTRTHGGITDWLGYFTSKEHRFASLTRSLNDRKSLRAGELAGMAALAYDIEEPEAAAQWTDRLVREHPESPWALQMRTQQIHVLEMRDAPRDSIALLVRSLDTLLAKVSGAPSDPWTLQGVIERNGDSAMLRRWTLRTARFGAASTDLLGRQAQLRDLEIRDSVESGARETIARLANARGPRGRMDRAIAYGQLASVALARREYRRVVALTDSSRLSPCRLVGQDTRGLAYLALGDTTRAEDDLLVFAKGEWAGADSVRRLLGARAKDPHWTQAVDSAWAARRDCMRRERGDQ